MLQVIPCDARSRWECSLAYRLPRSEWATRPSPGSRWATAISRASTTSRLPIRSDIDQPTIRRECRSSTAARYSHPSRVGMYVISMV
jgi:hypothetical protein